MEQISGTQIAFAVVAALLAYVAIETAASAYASPQPVVMEQPAMVPVYELRRQQEEQWLKSGFWHRIV
ncbi:MULTISPECIES: hypothetical protein [unclassified Mesorhizobium]|uniref:hypothetical protein n=1 Tax=unclassified Mesorhizobium TaxID=325217 RepID=UPI000FCCC930|nr:MULTISPECIES: hypothetical protein [unclassified Mesorhizobium]RUX93795.1 hypothetical protein EN993_18070 [Mesorhizobium sp. M7D.F.Ca.US.004.01.2.1]RVA34874.1 hypothetical protein EN935_05530 [Mesorhizobium sp. M7D.F.Ca.US.004.03.1.1]